MAARNLGLDYEFTVRAPTSIKRKLVKVARMKNASQGQVVRDLLDEGLDREIAQSAQAAPASH